MRLPMPTLTSREQEITRLLGEGKSCKEVANLVKLSISTVGVHCRNARRKLGLRSYRDLILYAIKNNLIDAQKSQGSTSTRQTS
jgi:DNA-binding CsgD family transcriptional regulator